MFQAISAARRVDVMQLQRVAASGIRSEVMEPAQYDGTLACDKPCDEESFVQPFASDSCLERLVPHTLAFTRCEGMIGRYSPQVAGRFSD
jgi:hypothetical protein